MQVLRDELPDIDVTVSSSYSPDLADALARGRLDLGFCGPNRDSISTIASSAGRSSCADAERPPADRASGDPPGGSRGRDVHHGVEQGEGAARRDRAVSATERVDVTPDHGVDNLAMAMSLVASTRGLALMPEYANNLLPWSVVSRPLEGDAPTVDLVIGYSRSNTSPVLKLFLSKAEELSAPFTTRSS